MNVWKEAYITIGLRKKAANNDTCVNGACYGDWHTLDRQGNTMPVIDYQVVAGTFDGYQKHDGGDCAYSLYHHPSDTIHIRATPCSTTHSWPLCQRAI